MNVYLFCLSENPSLTVYLKEVKQIHVKNSW